MLSEERNRILTQVGAQTPMGELMRRYWHPIAAVSELEENAIKPVRLMGEDLTLFRDLSGQYGLVDRHCPHRRASLANGIVEACGIRCSYHGWLFAPNGQCLEQPYEDTVAPEVKFRARISTKAYKVQAHRGLLWAYLGPDPAPLVPNWEPFTWPNGFVQIVFAELPCNWMQCLENSIDPVHFEWQHSNWSIRLSGKDGPYSPRHVQLAFEEFEHGFVYRRIREDTDMSNELWTVGRVCLWPNALYTGSHFEWRVPIDDENTLSVTWMFARVPRDREPFEQQTIPSWYGPIKDANGKWINSHIMNQDFLAWAGQGTIADRTQEHLGRSDQGVTMIRKRFFDDIEAIRGGVDPKATIRSFETNRCIALPTVGRSLFVEGLTREQIRANPALAEGITPTRYIFQAGQPEHVRRAMEQALGHRITRDGVVTSADAPDPDAMSSAGGRR
jgi:5,5'-dehydrodivanillate O-demethylase oxygenase subunit